MIDKLAKDSRKKSFCNGRTSSYRSGYQQGRAGQGPQFASQRGYGLPGPFRFLCESISHNALADERWPFSDPALSSRFSGDPEFVGEERDFLGRREAGPEEMLGAVLFQTKSSFCPCGS